MSSNKKYWKAIEQVDSLSNSFEELEHKEFISKLPENFLSDEKTLNDSNTSRRDFLKYVGFSTAAAAAAACEGPVIKSVPYVVQPEQIRPGIANYYATTIADGYDFASVLVKTREGRPIKIESNSDSSFFGCANARVHASVLSMYDSLRLQGPKLNQSDISWESFVMEFKEKLKALEEFKRGNFKIFNLSDVSKSQKMIWVICYEPLVGFDCTLPNNKKDTWILIETKQNHFLNSRLYEIK